jgi:hypothetical protein
VLTPFVPDEVKERSRQDKEWDKLIWHLKRGRRTAAAEIRELFREALAIVTIDDSRHAISSLVRAYRRRVESAVEWLDAASGGVGEGSDALALTRNGRHDLVVAHAKWFSSITVEGDPAETILDAMLRGISDEDGDGVSFDLAYPGSMTEERTRNYGARLFGSAGYMALLMWSHSDSRKPSWTAPYVSELSKVHVEDGPRLTITRLQRAQRNGLLHQSEAIELLSRVKDVPCPACGGGRHAAGCPNSGNSETETGAEMAAD